MADDAAPTFPNRSAQLIIDFQRAMDNNAPVSLVMINELKAVLGIGLAAHADCAKLHASAADAEAKAEQLQTEAGDLIATIHGAQ